MGAPGPIELLIIALILFLVALPAVVIIALVVVLIKRSKTKATPEQAVQPANQ